jgi:hypothetical protein
MELVSAGHDVAQTERNRLPDPIKRHVNAVAMAACHIWFAEKSLEFTVLLPSTDWHVTQRKRVRDRLLSKKVFRQTSSLIQQVH